MMRPVSVSFSKFQYSVLERMVGSTYGSTMSAVVRFIVQTYIGEHGDKISNELAKYEEWKRKGGHLA